MSHWNIDPLAECPKYDSIRQLGEGTFGSVYHARNTETGEEVAIKLICLGDKFYKKYVAREILNHRELIHPHIVSFKEVFATSRHLAIVMEYVGGGNLQSFVEKHSKIPEWQARCFFQQLILALHYIHKSLGIAHRDIKLGNILLNDKYQVPILKLCDFGYSKNNWMGSLPKTRVGTAAYISPEVARANTATIQYDTEKADVWSSAVTLYCMLSGRYPFTDGGRVPQLHHIKALSDSDVDHALQRLVDISPGCKNLMYCMLRTAPEQRIALDDIIQDDWYRQYLPDVSKMVARKPVFLQDRNEILQVLAQAEQRSKEISEQKRYIDIDEAYAMKVADEILDDLEDEDFDVQHDNTLEAP